MGDRGCLAQLQAGPAVAIVGARRASPYGIEVAHMLGRDLAVAGVPVVSGMALGADSAAHEGALEAGGLTVAVLAGGPDRPYPASKRRLHARIAARGLAVSELPPGTQPLRWCFPARNRIMAGLAAMTIVVEGAAGSGSLITAGFAHQLGREVGAVPGQVTSRLAQGPHALIADGACLVRSAEDALDAIFGVGRAARGSVEREPPPLTPALSGLLSAVEQGHTSLEQLVGKGDDVADALAALSELELMGLIRRAPGGGYVRTA
jgi:DNA processing protein